MSRNSALATCIPTLEIFRPNDPGPFHLAADIDRIISRGKLGRDRFGGVGLGAEMIVSHWYVGATVALAMDPDTGEGILSTFETGSAREFSLLSPVEVCWTMLTITDSRLLGYVSAIQHHALYPSDLAFSLPYELLYSVDFKSTDGGTLFAITTESAQVRCFMAKRPTAKGTMKDSGVPDELMACAKQIVVAAAQYHLKSCSDPENRQRLEGVMNGEASREGNGDLVAWIVNPELPGPDLSLFLPRASGPVDGTGVSQTALEDVGTSPHAVTESPDGWYADPWGRHEYRYFESQAWTQHVSDGGVPSIDPG